MNSQSFQDDSRENQMIQLFDLRKNKKEGRSGVDAFLHLDGNTIPFELKTTSKKSVTTARDFNPEHARKWKEKHWLFGFYSKEKVYYQYATPEMMSPWINEKLSYIALDLRIAELLPGKLTISELYDLCGKKSEYTYEDVSRIQKKQYKKEYYLQLQDLPNGYSPKRVLEILTDRARYLIERGSTLNNPHIPAKYFTDWEKITENHALRLRNLVRKSLKKTKL